MFALNELQDLTAEASNPRGGAEWEGAKALRLEFKVILSKLVRPCLKGIHKKDSECRTLVRCLSLPTMRLCAQSLAQKKKNEENHILHQIY